MLELAQEREAFQYDAVRQTYNSLMFTLGNYYNKTLDETAIQGARKDLACLMKRCAAENEELCSKYKNTIKNCIGLGIASIAAFCTSLSLEHYFITAASGIVAAASLIVLNSSAIKRAYLRGNTTFIRKNLPTINSNKEVWQEELERVKHALHNILRQNGYA